MENDNLPALITRAGQRLLDARTSGEVLEAKRIAEAALHYARVTKAANDTHADCIRIITRAEIRMANELDRGQEDGKLSRQQDGRPKSVRTSDASWSSSDIRPATYEDLGISRQRASEWRDVRDVGEEVVENAISRALAEGRAPTKSEILEAAREIKGESTAQKAQRRAEKEAALAAVVKDLSAKIGHQLYGVILADPPWRFEPYSRETGMDRAADNHYATTLTDEIASLDVDGAAASDCVLFLWATAPMLLDALRVMEAWGFTYKSQIIWVKDRIGTGYWARNKHEILLIGTRGSIPAPSPGQQPNSVIEAPVTEHSRKPDEFHDIIEKLFPSLPKLEMFARRGREGWDVWGNEVTNDG